MTPATDHIVEGAELIKRVASRPRNPREGGTIPSLPARGRITPEHVLALREWRGSTVEGPARKVIAINTGGDQTVEAEVYTITHPSGATMHLRTDAERALEFKPWLVRVGAGSWHRDPRRIILHEAEYPSRAAAERAMKEQRKHADATWCTMHEVGADRGMSTWQRQGKKWKGSHGQEVYP